MLKYTGHPLVDVGAATIAAFAKKRDLSAITSNDLIKIAEYIADAYPNTPFKTYLTMAFTTNAWFIQDAYNPDKKDLTVEERKGRRETRAKWASAHLLQWQESDNDQVSEKCIFTGEPAIRLPLSNKLPEGRGGRAQIPLLLGDEDINFYSNGDTGLPISGIALLCLQAFPLGSARCGKPLVVHSDNPDLTYAFASKFLAENRKAIQLSREAKEMPKTGASAKTTLIKTLIEIEQERKIEKDDLNPYSVTAYHLSNSGQGPSLEIYYLPLELIGFLQAITGVAYHQEWKAIEREAWQLTKAQTDSQKQTKPKKGKAKSKEEKSTEDTKPRRNFLYEDLFRLPGNARQFIRRYFLRIPSRNFHKDDPRRNYSVKNEASLVKWKITTLFLERIMRMNETRIQRIREMGEQLASYINEENDQKFFTTFYAAKDYGGLRNALIRVNHARLKKNQLPIMRFDPYVEIFEDVDERGRTDWRLARDLILIRMIERLYELKWIEQHQDVIPDVSDDEIAEEKGEK